MNIGTLMAEMATALGTIPDLRVYDHPPETLTNSAAYVDYPDAVEYDQTYGNGSVRLSIPVVVTLGKVVARTTKDRATPYMAPAGASSVKAALQGGTYSEAHVVTVTRAEVEYITFNSTEYLGVTFDVDVFGPGS